MDVVALADSNVFLTITEQTIVLWMFICILYDIPVYLLEYMRDLFCMSPGY